MGLSLTTLVYRRFNARCLYCRKYLERDKASLEHLIPLSKGGTNHKDNLALACKACNSHRGNSDVAAYICERAKTTPSQALKAVSEANGFGAVLRRLLRPTQSQATPTADGNQPAL